MNERDFILLVEKHLDGTLSPDERTALRNEVGHNPDHRRLFEEQARQHIRIHAQTSRVDFTESQHIAVMVMDIAEKHKDPNAFMELLRTRTFRERVKSLIAGLRADKDSWAYHAAKAELMRMFGPMTVSVAVNVALILMIFCWVPFMTPPLPKNEGVSVTLNTPTPPPDLDPIITPEAPASAPQERIIPVILSATVITPRMPGPESPVQPDSGTTAGEPVLPDMNRVILDNNQATPLQVNVDMTRYLQKLNGRTVDSRQKILAGTIGSSDTESAVTRSLHWLKAHQSKDGSWPGQDSSAMTGLALLAFLAHSEVPGTQEYGDTVTLALKYLLARQDSKGAFSPNVYAHAIATYALAEAFTMTRIIDLKAPLEKATRVILDGQQRTGGFDYSFKKELRFDVSVTGWQIQALKAAKIAGAELAGLDEGLALAASFLQTAAFSHDGSGFVYEGKTGTPALTGGKTSMTGVGTLCLQMLGKSSSPQVISGLRTLENAEFEWPASGKAGVYSGYYITQAKFQGGDKRNWANWNRKMQRTLISRQNTDGHWEQGDYDNGSHVYTTTLCTLMLEVYYRYLPTYAKRPESLASEKTPSGDISVDVR